MMRVPRATYRLQFRPEFGFRQAAEILGYLEELGVSDVYASPIFQARQGSTHGYDVVDPTALNPELGSEEDFKSLSEAVRGRGMGWLQDIVPNHMAYASENRMLLDVLENGRRSPFAPFFDIDWSSPYDPSGEWVLAPFLGSFYGEGLERGEITLEYGPEGFGARYYGLRLPLRPESYEALLSEAASVLREELGDEDPHVVELLGVLYILKTLPAIEDAQERTVQLRFVKRLLWRLHTEGAAVRAALEGILSRLNGRAGVPESFDELDHLLGGQHFRLSYWKVATEEINYRRFFSINDLIALRVEREEVFEHTHRRILDSVKRGLWTGLRVDHVDGLYDPGAYLARLRAELPETYVVLEKILARREELPADWPIQGTSGYDFVNELNGLFVDEGSAAALTKAYARISGERTPPDEILYQKKKLILYRHLSGDVDNLARLLKSVSSTHRRGTDITAYGLRRAIVEAMASFPVYRTYAGETFSRPSSTSSSSSSASSCSTSARAGAWRSGPAGSLLPPVSAVYRAAHGQGLRRHVPLRLLSPPVRQRSRRRSAPARDGRERLPRLQPSARGAFAPRPERDGDPRHQARRRHPRAAQRPLRDPGRVDPGGHPLAPAQRGQASPPGRQARSRRKR